MKGFFINTESIQGCINRLENVESTLHSLSSSVDNISSTLGGIGLGEIVPNVVALCNRLNNNSKKVNNLNGSLHNIVNRYLLAESNILAMYYGAAAPDGRNITQLKLKHTMNYAEKYLLEHGYSESDIEYLRRNYPEYLASLNPRTHWSSFATIDAALERHQDDFLYFPEPGSTITVSPGTDLPSYECPVANTNAWSLEYSISSCQKAYGGSDCWKRLNYAIEHYDYNKGEQDLLQFNLDGYDEPVFAGAMIEGYADVGDVVYVTLDNGEGFYFMILDTKSNQHPSAQLKPGQVQYENGHGYMTDSGSVQLSNCEFIMSDWVPGVDSAKYTESGAFLNGTNVVSAEIIDHVGILE